MSDQQDLRRFKRCMWGLFMFGLMLTYMLGFGPWLYVSVDLPAVLVMIGDMYYAPIGKALESESFDETPIGELYIRYLDFWVDLRIGDGLP